MVSAADVWGEVCGGFRACGAVSRARGMVPARRLPCGRVGSGLSSCAAASVSIAFQSAPPRGGRLASPEAHREEKGFNPRPRAGGDPPSPPRGFNARRRVEFQFAPPRGGRPSLNTSMGRAGTFQSAPPRGGRPSVRLRHRRHPRVSIRAPARGATWRAIVTIESAYGFNPRPRAGGDRSSRRCSSPRRRFNPRPRAGGATVALLHLLGELEVSIRAPARGATGRRGLRGSVDRFNPRPRAGGD